MKLELRDRVRLSKAGVYAIITDWHQQRGLKDKYTNRQGMVVGFGGLDRYTWVYVRWDNTNWKQALNERYLEKVA